jgi:bacteriorhodopsin
MGQYSLVYNMLSFTIASMLASFVFFILAQNLLSQKYKISMVVSSLVVGIAAYHYFRIFQSWEAAYALNNGSYVPTGKPFNDAYRYVDWMLTVPLLMVELIAVLALAAKDRAVLTTKLVIAAALMIALGYPGEIMDEKKIFGLYGVWGTLSTIPFIYILYVLWVELGKFMADQPEKVRVLVRNIRLLTLATWGFYPIAYIIGAGGGGESAGAEVGLQVGYSIADVLAKCGYGVMIYHIARAKMVAEGDPLAKDAH